MTTHFTAGMGALWAQINGPNTQPVYLGCHQVGDIAEPQGDVTLIYCPDPSGPNRFKVVGSVQGAAGSVTSSVTTDVTDELDHLERIKCPFPLYINMVKAGRRDVFTNFDRAFILTEARVTSRGLTAISARTPDDNSRSEQSFDLSAESLIRFMVLNMSAQTISEANAINDITFCNDQACRTDEDPAMESCQSGYAACDAAAGAKANVLHTTNGATWAATNADPFANDENISGVECFELGRNETRVIVAKGSADIAAPPRIAYSDNAGVAWTVVSVGTASENNDYIISAHALFALDRNNIWAASNAGGIWRSNDAGLTWTELDQGTVIAGAINAVHFVDENVGWMAGAANAIARSLDGGDSWEVVTGPTAQAGVAVNVVFALDRNRAWLGYADGDLYYTTDGGDTWHVRSFSGAGTGQVRDIKFWNDHVGYMIKNTAGPVATVLYTIDGGFTWTGLDTPSNSGGNVLFVCDLWSFFCCGEVTSGTGFIARGSI